MILGICDSPEVLSIINIIIIVIKIIRIVVPIILMVSIMIGITKAIMKNDNDALAKSLKTSAAKIIAAILIFLIPTLVNVIADIVGTNDYKQCIDLTTTIDIRDAYVRRADELINIYRESEEENDYLSAKYYISTIRYPDIRQEKLDELEQLHEEILGKQNPGGEGVIDGSCFAEYENGSGNAYIYLNSSKVTGTHYKIKNAGKVVSDGTATSYKSNNSYELLLHPGMEITLDNGRTKKVECEVKHKTPSISYYKDGYYFRKQSTQDKTAKVNNPFPQNGISYYLYLPPNFDPNTKYPLVLALHGGFGWSVPCKGSTTSEANQTYHFLKSALYINRYPINKVDNADVNAIVIAPSNMTCNWEGSIYKALDILHAYIKMFNVDIDSVVVTGTSQGGYGTMYAGFLEEHIIYTPTDSETTLDSVAQMYNTTADAIRQYNKSIKVDISYSDNKKTKLSKGSHLIVKPKSEENMRSLFSVLVPMSPAKNATRCAFVPSTIYDKDADCKKTPPYTIKTPIWVITSNDEYEKIQMFAKELTAYYEQNGDIRYTVLSNIQKYYKTSPHNTQIPVLGYSSALDWMISQKYGSVQTRNNTDLDNIEKQLSNIFVKDFHP